MNYVEWLRVRNLLRNVAIVLGILVVLALVLRVSVSRYMSPDAWISHFENHPGVQISQSTLPDGHEAGPSSTIGPIKRTSSLTTMDTMGSTSS